MTKKGPARILIVEDDPDVCWAAKRVAAQMGYQPVAAEKGDETIHLIRSNHFRLALVDAKLPDIEGIEVASRLRTCQPGLPVVLISGYFYADDPSVREWIESGLIQGFVSKPFELSDLRRTLSGAAGADDP